MTSKKRKNGQPHSPSVTTQKYPNGQWGWTLNYKIHRHEGDEHIQRNQGNRANLVDDEDTALAQAKRAWNNTLTAWESLQPVEENEYSIE